MHLAILVVGERTLLQTGFNGLVGNLDGAAFGSTDNKLEDVEQLARVAAAVSQYRSRLLQPYVEFPQFRVIGYRTAQQLQQVVLLQRLQHIQLASGKQRPYHLK